ncbi:MAG: tetratricopeptide repeat protein [Candidatus Pacebacteria bacterium]|nr:tetratricopeptide repeat protein [Candidatus Paceibacterota bacterium]
MDIAVKTKGQLAASLQRMHERAEKAIQQHNYDYACDILRNLLAAEPGFNDGRLTLRQAQLERIGFKASIVRQIVASIKTAWSIYVSGPLQLKKGNVGKALDIGEKALQQDPTLTSTLHFQARAAKAAGLSMIAVNCMEIAARFHPNSKQVLKSLASSYKEAGENIKSLQVYQKLRALSPDDLEVQNELKHATALAAMREARWEEAGSYRELIRDREEAETLEQQERIATRDVDSREHLIEKTIQEIDQKPTAGNYTKLATLYHENNEFDKAIEAYRKIPEVTGTADPALESTITDVLRDKYGFQISQLHEQMQKNPEKKQALQDQLAKVEMERDEVLLGRYEDRVRHYPNESRFRFELGQMYVQFDRWDDAMREFQQSQRSPRYAKRAQLYMGKCLVNKGLFDMAVEQYLGALEDPERLSSQEYKEALYELACALEKKGDSDEALKRFKELYSQDVNYRDVAKRLEKYYEQPE